MSPKTKSLTLLDTSVWAFMRYLRICDLLYRKLVYLPIHVYIVIIEIFFYALTGGAYFAPVQSAFSLYCLAATRGCKVTSFITV